jgi:hypothetical protein
VLIKCEKMRPPPLGAYNPNFVPPVTGVSGSMAPVANVYDSSGNFQSRGRAGSFKRRRVDEEIDRIYDLSEDYPPLTRPQRPELDLTKVKGLVVEAGTAAENVREMLKDDNLDPKVKSLALLSIAIVEALSAAVEDGLVPVSTAAPGNSKGLAGATLDGGKFPPPTAAKPTVAPGLRELKEGLQKADNESIIFDADLGPATMANRKSLAGAFSAGIRSATIAKAVAEGQDPAEAVRVMDDAISCITDMEFIGSNSQRFKNKNNAIDSRNDKFCTMPIRVKFDDRNARIHFETVSRKLCDLRASISLPKPIRVEQAAFLRAVRDRYPGKVVTSRVDMRNLSLTALWKEHGAKSWTLCPEAVGLNPGTLLPDYVPRTAFDLGPVIVPPHSDDSSQMSVEQPSQPASS